MGTKLREEIWGGQIMGAAIRAKQAREVLKRRSVRPTSQKWGPDFNGTGCRSLPSDIDSRQKDAPASRLLGVGVAGAIWGAWTLGKFKRLRAYPSWLRLEPRRKRELPLGSISCYHETRLNQVVLT